MLQADFVQHIAKLAEDGTITGLSDIRDESDRDGMRVVVEMKRGTSAQVCCTNLYQTTDPWWQRFPRQPKCRMFGLLSKRWSSRRWCSPTSTSTQCFRAGLRATWWRWWMARR